MLSNWLHKFTQMTQRNSFWGEFYLCLFVIIRGFLILKFFPQMHSNWFHKCAQKVGFSLFVVICDNLWTGVLFVLIGYKQLGISLLYLIVNPRTKNIHMRSFAKLLICYSSDDLPFFS